MATQTQTLPLETPKIRRITFIETRFHNRMGIDQIVQYLRGLRATGEIKISLSQGGVNAIVFEEREKQ